MVETAAHFTSTVSVNPSIFEILAQNSLQNVLHPALEKIALFLATNSPKHFNWLNHYYDEVFLVLNGTLQYHYFKNYDASFAENFYGLQRVATISNNKLTQQQKLLSLVFLAVSPYLRRKLEARLALYRFEHSENSLPKNLTGLSKKSLLAMHSLFEAAWGSWLLFNYLRYMAGKTESQTPVLQLLGLKLVYAEQNDSFPNFWSALFRGNLSFSEFGSGLIRNAVTSTLELSAFFIQFLQAWNAEKSNYDVTALPTVPPPAYDNRANNYEGKCPICLQAWKIPTILPVSGYVFCFQCILKHLRENQKCPVTNLPANPLDIVRMYDNE